MNTTLDTLTMTGCELTTEQLSDVDGGLVVLVTCTAIWALGTFDAVLWWAILSD